MKKVMCVCIVICLFCGGIVYGADNVVQFEYDGQIIEVNLEDLYLTENGIELYETPVIDATGFMEDDPPFTGNRREITEQEYREEQRAQQWLNIQENLEIRTIDERALELVREFYTASGVVGPQLGTGGAVVIAYGAYVPKILCRPMYVTDIILEPGEFVTGIHPGDTSRWAFVPGEVGEGNNRQTSVLVKPLMADISTNLIIMTTRRRYHVDLVSSAENYMPSVSFTYPEDGMRQWDNFINARRDEGKNETVIETGYQINPEDLHLNYSIEGNDNLRWKPIAVYDDGIKTYIRFSERSTIRSVEAPVFVVFERRREIIVNYRWAQDMMIIDRVFDVGGLIVGAGAAQSRVTIRRLK